MDTQETSAMTIDPIQALIADFDAPRETPAPYRPSPDAVAWRYLEQRRCVQEIYRRTDGRFGSRWRTWVGWAAAGGTRRHDHWTTVIGLDNSVAPCHDEARVLAEIDAANRNARTAEGWVPVG